MGDVLVSIQWRDFPLDERTAEHQGFPPDIRGSTPITKP